MEQVNYCRETVLGLGSVPQVTSLGSAVAPDPRRH